MENFKPKIEGNDVTGENTSFLRKKLEEASRRIDEMPDKKIIESAEKRLSELGLTFEDLRNKRSLDLGSGTQIIERAAALKGISSVLSVDSREYVLSKRPEVKNGIVADIKAGIPQIGDETLDLVISHAGPPTISAVSKVKEDFDRSLDEVLRMLKTGGEARLFPLRLRFIEERHEQYKNFRAKREKDLTAEERQEKSMLEKQILDESFDYIKEKGIDITLADSGKGLPYGIIKKR
jgi:hypothetical protein